MHPSAILVRLPALLARDPLAHLYPTPKNSSTADINGAGSPAATQARLCSERQTRVAGVNLASNETNEATTRSGGSVKAAAAVARRDLNTGDRRPRNDPAIANPYRRDGGASGAAAGLGSRDGE